MKPSRIVPLLPICVAVVGGAATPAAHPGPGQEAPAHGTAARKPLSVPAETYVLPNGMLVTLHVDHSLPKTVIDTWFDVGSKDEQAGRTGFAHLFEHLMVMGTGRAPGNAFDVLMEKGGGSNNAETTNDRTQYYSIGPRALLPTLLWLDADRLDSLADYMTQEKLDLQREVVRNERRQTTENQPYGKSELLLEPALYPPGHPYHHPVIGSHEDLEAATLEDVVRFFRTYYVPANASLVVAGDFDPDQVRGVIQKTFGAIPAQPEPPRVEVPPVRLEREKRVVATDRVQFPKIWLAWHSPAELAPGDAEMELIADVLAGSPSSRLEKRLVLEDRVAQEVDAYQWSRELGSVFVIEAVASPGVDLEKVKSEILDVVAELREKGPTPAELERVRAQTEASFLEHEESLLGRAESMNRYLHYFGAADGFERDLQRYLGADAQDLVEAARGVFVPGRVDLRILPEDSVPPESSLDTRPADFSPSTFEPPTPKTLTLSNGWRLHAIERPGSGLFAGSLLLGSGAGGVPAPQAGLDELFARVADSGAGGKDASLFASAVESLGASMDCSAGRTETTYSLDGLSSRLGGTLDLFADLVLRPNLDAGDFEREKDLDLAAIRARKDDPRQMASQIARILLFGRDAAFGRPVSGWSATVQGLSLDDVKAVQRKLLDSRQADLVFVGDFDTDALKAELEKRFSTQGRVDASPEAQPEPHDAAGRLVLFDRPGAPQTVIYAARPVQRADGAERAARSCVDTVFGGTFTSRLNANLREAHGYSYGAGSRIVEERSLALLVASSAVRTDVTGASLTEIRKEFARMAADGIDADELTTAVETLRRRFAEVAETTSRMAATYTDLVRDGRPPDFLAQQLAALDDVTLEQVNAVARSGLFDWGSLLIVLVGDQEKVLPQLEAAGFPAPTIVDEAGQPAQ